MKTYLKVFRTEGQYSAEEVNAESIGEALESFLQSRLSHDEIISITKM